MLFFVYLHAQQLGTFELSGQRETLTRHCCVSFHGRVVFMSAPACVRCAGTGIPPAPRGVPQIDVSFDVDANGILNVSAEDKSTGNRNRITITNDTGRLSKEQIERMLKEAEEMKEQDKLQQQRIDAKNRLEQYLYGLRSTLQDDHVKAKLSDDERRKVEDVVKDALDWLQKNEMAEQEELDFKLKEAEAACAPIIKKLYEQGGREGGAGMGGGMPDMGGTGGMGGGAGGGGGGQGPKVEEVD